MVIVSRDAVRLYQLSHLLAKATVSYIDDGTSLYPFQYADQLILFAIRSTYHIGQVTPFEAHSEDVRTAKAQTQLDILHHLWGGRSGQC